MIAPYSETKDRLLPDLAERARMKSPFLPLCLLVALFAAIAALWPADAFAQSDACRSIRAELASLPRGGANRASNGLRRELGRVQGALAANDCYRSRGFLGLGGLPPVCAPLKAQAGQLQAQISAAEGGGSDARRAQLMAAWQRYDCDGAQRVRAPEPQRGVLYATPNDRPGILDRLFGTRTEVPVESFPPRGVAPPGVEPFDDSLRGETADDDSDREPRRRRGGSLAVCVRTCDGFFFPVNFEGLRARNEYGEVCQALCPSAETRVYFMSHGGNIEDAVSEGGEPYTALPAAKKYQEERNLSCICKRPEQTWASAMKGKPDLVEMRKGDIVVSKEQAEQMSRPKELREPTLSKRQQREAQQKLEQAPAAPPPPQATENGGRIKQKSVFVDAEGGVRTEIQREGGAPAQSRQDSIRNVAPGLSAQGLRNGSGEAARP